jgi:dephospho-CoA kinase
VVYDVPLLAEARLADPWDVIVVAHAPADVRARRLVELRGLTPSEAAARISSQVSDEERLRLADAVIETGGTVEETLRQTDELWERLRG